MEDMVVHHIVVMALHTRHIHHIIDTAMARMVLTVHMVHMDHHIIGLDMEE